MHNNQFITLNNKVECRIIKVIWWLKIHFYHKIMNRGCFFSGKQALSPFHMTVEYFCFSLTCIDRKQTHTHTCVCVYIYIYIYIYIQYVHKVLRLKLYLLRQKSTNNVTLIFLNIVSLAFNLFIPVEASWKHLQCEAVLNILLMSFISSNLALKMNFQCRKQENII